MPRPPVSASPTPGPSGFSGKRDRIAEALHAWAIKNFDPGYVFSQDELLNAGIIPDQKLEILLTSTQHLVNKSLFKLHDRVGGTIGWELVEETKAKNHAGLTRDERLVYNCIENAGNAGIWNKTIKNRIAAHAQIMERVIKSLTNKGLIKSMTTVKHPGRKMYIVSNLLPNEEATGGAWFSGSDLDTPLLNGIAAVVHLYIAEQSWQEVDPIDHVSSPSNKRKAPADGFDDEGDSRSKAPRIDDSPNHKKKHSSKSSARARSYRPFDASYQKYPTLPDICSAILKSKVTGVVLPQNAIAQLLEVMFYDEKLYKVTRKATGMEDEDPDNVADIVMWRSYKTPAAVAHEMELTKRKLTDTGDSRRTALRQLELEEVGRGGATEVPCMKCPVFDICGDGGPISARTCKYFDEWYLKLADADREAGVGVYAPMGKGKEKAKDKDKGKEKAVFDVEFEVSQEGDDEMQDS